ncbi:MAG: transposase [Firmicutes bacterium]|nr:transposase [Bacillota bacterium]
MRVCRELKSNVLFRWFCGNRPSGPIPDDTTWSCRSRALPSWKAGPNCARLGLFVHTASTDGRPGLSGKDRSDGIQGS